MMQPHENSSDEPDPAPRPYSQSGEIDRIKLRAMPRALFLSPVDMRTKNGMAQLQHQLLSTLCSIYGDRVDLLSLAASPARARSWLHGVGLRVNVLGGLYPTLAWLNTMLWYGGGVILCNKLHWIDRFHFPLRTPLPRTWIKRYDTLVCFYPWAYHLLRLDRVAENVIVDTGDVMADRHERIGARRWISLAFRDERAIIKSRSKCLAVSVDDADEFERLYGERLPVQSFVPPEHQQLIALAAAERPKRLGYMGAPGYGNEQLLRSLAAREFLDCLALAGIEFVVAGGICNTIDPRILRAIKKGGARILGPTPSTVDYYREISATVNPVGPSTGVKIKSVETLVAGRHLVTTRWGADRELAAAFPEQITFINWPEDPSELGKLCVRVIKEARPSSAATSENYVRRVTLESMEMLKP